MKLVNYPKLLPKEAEFKARPLRPGFELKPLRFHSMNRFWQNALEQTPNRQAARFAGEMKCPFEENVQDGFKRYHQLLFLPIAVGNLNRVFSAGIIILAIPVEIILRLALGFYTAWVNNVRVLYTMNRLS